MSILPLFVRDLHGTVPESGRVVGTYALGVVVAVGAGGALSTLLQARLMDVVGEGQALAAALNHSAFNAANA